jgi:ribosome recycling factor
MDARQIHEQAQKKMHTTVEGYRKDLGTVRTGRASLALLDGLTVEYYGQATPLNGVATLSVPEPALILVQPWDRSLIQEIERSIMASGLGLTPSNDGKVVRIPIPPLTEERRKELARKVSHMGEERKTAVRQLRREANDELKALLKEKKISEDDERRALEQIQKTTDHHIQQIDQLTKAKEKEILEIG